MEALKECEINNVLDCLEDPVVLNKVQVCMMTATGKISVIVLMKISVD
jgi:hypothetical protein